MPLSSVGSVGDEHERQIWLEPRFVDRLRAMRGPGESYSDVILRLAKGEKTPSSHADAAALATRYIPRSRGPQRKAVAQAGDSRELLLPLRLDQSAR
jgi:hypothetical protein